jgi:hypothetical protein
MKFAACGFVLGLFLTAPAFSADAARSRITADELRSHVATLAADSFEGREAGRRGGQAAAAYILSELKRLDVKPAGEGGGFVQEFGAGYRNILVVIPGSDERLKDEVIVAGAHYDHVGFGAKGSLGGAGQIHNGADDNASGTAALLELVEAFASSAERPKRTLLFGFWDAEEKGLLGSEHWAGHPTVPLSNVKFALNFDMLGRLRNRTLEVYGVRTAAGLRRLVSEQNAGADLTLTFDWSQKDDSDHWSFYKRRIPYLMLHTGLHDEYHKPSDDANLINIEGLHEVTELCRRTIVAVADAPATPFRSECTGETNETAKQLGTPLPQPPSRLGLRWDAERGQRGEFVVTAVVTGSPAAKAGLRAGDRIEALNGAAPADTLAFRRAVLAAGSDVTLTVRRGAQSAQVPVHLAGTPIRVGITWRLDDAEPGAVILRQVVAGSPADEAGLKAGDRILQVNGESFADEAGFRAAFRAAGETPGLLVEREGRLRTVGLRIKLPDEEAATIPERTSNRAAGRIADD